jgi:hypothetical protein
MSCEGIVAKDQKFQSGIVQVFLEDCVELSLKFKTQGLFIILKETYVNTQLFVVRQANFGVQHESNISSKQRSIIFFLNISAFLTYGMTRGPMVRGPH